MLKRNTFRIWRWVRNNYFVQIDIMIPQMWHSSGFDVKQQSIWVWNFLSIICFPIKLLQWYGKTAVIWIKFKRLRDSKSSRFRRLILSCPNVILHYQVRSIISGFLKYWDYMIFLRQFPPVYLSIIIRACFRVDIIVYFTQCCCLCWEQT